MRYIWIISDIYRTPSAILFPQKVLRPPLPGPPTRTAQTLFKFP